MKPYQERVVEEKKQLDEKVEKLTVFISTSKDYTNLSGDEQGLLDDQLTVMRNYSELLGKRIKLFK